MSRAFHPQAELLYEAAGQIVQKAFASDDSFLTPGKKVWTLENVRELRKRFVEHPDVTPGKSFEDKLREQLAEATTEQIQLAVEILFAYLWIVSVKEMKAESKLALITLVVSWMPEPLTIPPFFREALGGGFVRTGTAYHASRNAQFEYWIELTVAWKSKSSGERLALLQDPWAFRDFVMAIHVKGGQPSRHTILHLVFPDTFESIVSAEHKRRIADAFRKYAQGIEDDDRSLLAIREAMAPELGRPFEFYDADIKPKWFPEPEPAPGQTRSTSTSSKIPPVKGAPQPVVQSSPELGGLLSDFQKDAVAAGINVESRIAHRFLASLLSKPFLIVTGLSGSGKTQLARAVAHWLTTCSRSIDPFKPGSVLESSKKAYRVNDADRLSVEFENDEGTKVLLPRAVIEEWADYIERHAISESIGAQALRDLVKSESPYSGQLHSFETHYKPAAFALLKARQASGSEARCWELVSVGADWTGADQILGYPDGLDRGAYALTPTLSLLLRARANPQMPHFLVLDEMNLSHVERYFADFLSAIESAEELHLHSDRQRHAGDLLIPPSVPLPDNLFIVGTVNVDETTYMFSPKVLDRANVIEFRMDQEQLESFLSDPQKPNVSGMAGRGARYAEVFMATARRSAAIPDEWAEAFRYEMSVLFSVLKENGAEFGFRVAHESARFVSVYAALAEPSKGSPTLSDAMDLVVLQKILPKLHGSRAKLAPVLKALWFLATADPSSRGDDPVAAARQASRSGDRAHEPVPDGTVSARYPLTAEKLVRMWRSVNDNGFTAFAEA